MPHLPIKLDWFERAIQVYRFHVAQLRDEPKWTVNHTAIALNRSIGSVSQDLLIASWSRTHGNQLRQFPNMREALEWVRNKQKQMKMSDI